ncbi:MAG: hypothetical protein NTV46_13090 [Verrucomicrobia bacterium]|nr:hypothetical protein [Verrucomicrobiota bacterium]
MKPRNAFQIVVLIAFCHVCRVPCVSAAVAAPAQDAKKSGMITIPLKVEGNKHARN